MIVGNPSSLAIESSVTEAYESMGQRALGFFVLHVGGKCYGVRSPTATLLACSFDAVQRRIERRGQHRMQLGGEPDAMKIADAVRAAFYDEDRQQEQFFGMSASELCDELHMHEILWAPDGDAAFDDGGHVLQFDQGESIRLIAFKNAATHQDFVDSVVESWLSSEQFYATLADWRSHFESEWKAALRAASTRSG